MSVAARVGLEAPPARIAELGPGDSLGIGLAALVSGSQQYIGLDLLPYARNDGNLAILDELVDLFRRRETIPDPSEFPDIKPTLEDYSFPEALYPREWLEQALAPERIRTIRTALEALSEPNAPAGPVAYLAPWLDSSDIREQTVDLLFSQAVLEHVDPLEATYAAFQRWLRPGGLMSHEIDFRCHGLATRWNGHWGYSDLTWRVIRGTRPFLLNRRTVSFHRELLHRNGFEVLYEQPVIDQDGLSRDELARRYRALPDEDLRTSGLFFIARAVGKA